MKVKGTKGKESRERILEIALKLFIRKGYQAASISAISRQAKVTKGGIYHYFSSKEQLYYQALVSFFSKKEPPNWTKKPQVSIRDFVRNGFVGLAENKKNIQQLVGSNKDDAILYLYTFLYEATRKYPEFQKSLDEYDDCKRSMLSRTFRTAQENKEIRDDIDPELLAFEFDNYLQQLQYMKFLNPVMKNDTQMLEKLFENYWKRLKR